MIPLLFAVVEGAWGDARAFVSNVFQYPQASARDPLCSYTFSILVLGETNVWMRVVYHAVFIFGSGTLVPVPVPSFWSDRQTHRWMCPHVIMLCQIAHLYSYNSLQRLYIDQRFYAKKLDGVWTSSELGCIVVMIVFRAETKNTQVPFVLKVCVDCLKDLCDKDLPDILGHRSTCMKLTTHTVSFGWSGIFTSDNGIYEGVLSALSGASHHWRG